MNIKNYNLNSNYPHILVLSGVHGNETNSVKAVALSDFQHLGKSITVINAINKPGLIANTREYKESDHSSKDLNRSFFSEEPQLKDTVDTIKKLIQTCKIVVDVHSSPACKNMVLLGNTQKELVIKNILTNAGIPCISWSNTTDTIRSYANSIDSVIGITVELNGMGQVSQQRLDEEIEFLQTVINTLTESYQEIMYDYETGEQSTIENSGDDLTNITVRTEGIVSYEDFDKLFDKVFMKDDVICSIYDIRNRTCVEKIKAPWDNCVVLDAEPVAYATPGTTLLSFAKLDKYAEFVRNAKPKSSVKKEIKEEIKVMSETKSGLLADEKTVGYAFECEIDFANWCAENIGETEHGVVISHDELQNLDLTKYVEGVKVVCDDTPWDNFVKGDVRTNYFKADIKSSMEYPIASIHAYIPVEGVANFKKLGKTEQAAWRILAREYLEQSQVDYYISYGKDDEVNVIPRQLILDMLSEEGLKLESKDSAMGEVKSTSEIRTIKQKDYLAVYLPLSSWANQYAFRKQFMTLEDLVDLYK